MALLKIALDLCTKTMYKIVQRTAEIGLNRGFGGLGFSNPSPATRNSKGFSVRRCPFLCFWTHQKGGGSRLNGFGFTGRGHVLEKTGS
jgi:hypothetical protein